MMRSLSGNRTGCWVFAGAALLVALWAGTGRAGAQAAPPSGDVATEVAAAVSKDPDRAVRIVVDAVAGHTPEQAAAIVDAAMRALSPAHRKALAPSLVAAAIRALPTADRLPQAPACACAAIRAVPPLEQREVIPPVAVTAASVVPEARAKIVECALAAAPDLARVINAAMAAAVAPLPQVDADATTGSTLPDGSVGRDSLVPMRCASPPCPG